MSLKGSCLCGAVTYEVSGLDGPIAFCHCRTCQKSNAAPFLASARTSRQDFSWTGGEDVLSRFESSPGKERCFCSKCGSHLVADYVGTDLMVLRVATLDEDPGIKAGLHIHVSNDVPWMNWRDDLRMFEDGAG